MRAGVFLLNVVAPEPVEVGGISEINDMPELINQQHKKDKALKALPRRISAFDWLADFTK